MTNAILKKSEVRAALYILAAVIIAYANSLSNGFVYDDVSIIGTNPIIRDWANLGAVFTTSYWEPTGISEGGGLYRPLTIFTYLVEYSIVGLSPFLYHLDNVILHFLCSLLVYMIVKRVAGGETGPVAAALVFAVHPVHVEAVANVVGRAELLTSLFTLAGLYAFICRPRRIPWYILSPALMFLGLLSKETAIVLPLLVLAYVLLFERDGRGRGVAGVAASLAPYAVVTAVFIGIRFLVLADDISPTGTEQVLVYTKGYWRMLVMFKVFVRYIWLSLVPAPLYAHYMLRPPESFIDPWVFGFIAIYGGFLASSPWLYKNRPVYLFFGAWFLISLLPVSNIIPIGILMAERSMYLPSVGVCAALGLAFAWAASQGSPRNRGTAVAVIAATVLVSYGVLTHGRNKVWHDATSLNNELLRSYEYVIAEFPESGLYYINMAKTLKLMGKKEAALAATKKAVELEPDVASYHTELARLFAESGDYRGALAQTEKSLAMSKKFRPAEYALFAEVYYKNGMLDKAGELVAKALSADQGNYHEAFGEIATSLYKMEMFPEAEKYVMRAIELNPNYASYHRDYARLLILKGEDDAAWNELDIAESIEPGTAELYFMRGILLGKREKFSDAARALEKAASLNPKEPSIHYFLATAYIGEGRDDDAVRELEEALRLNPDFAEARNLLQMRPQ